MKHGKENNGVISNRIFDNNLYSDCYVITSKGRSLLCLNGWKSYLEPYVPWSCCF